MSDETQNSSLATQKAKLLWTTPRVVPLHAEVGTAGKTSTALNEPPASYSFGTGPS
jgi:hypothetical protein